MARGLLRVAAFASLLTAGIASLHVSQWLAASKYNGSRTLQNVYEQRKGHSAASQDKR